MLEDIERFMTNDRELMLNQNQMDNVSTKHLGRYRIRTH